MITNAYCADSSLYNTIQSRTQEKNKNEFNKKRQRYMSILEPYKISRSADRSNDHPGDKTIDKIEAYLNRKYRSPQQKEFHKSFLAASLRLVYKDEFLHHRHRIMQKYKFESRKQQVLVCAPRRMGKTFSVAYFAIAMAINVPSITISIFSPGKRQSSALMSHIRDWMKKLDESERIIQSNEEKMQVRALNGGVSRIYAYPSAVKTLKGVNGDIIILEEMAQIDPEVLYEVVVPLHQLDKTCVIGISTITDENNFFSKYLKMKNSHGDELFATKHIYLACYDCRKADRAAQCNHNSHLLPDWSSARKRKTINAMMAGQDEMLAREIGGVASSMHQKAFVGKLVNRFVNLETYDLPSEKHYPYFFTAIDPNGCGKSSDIAMVSMIKMNGMNILIGLESFPSKMAFENDNLIISHIESIRRDARFQNSMAIFIIENNYGLESERMGTLIEQNISNVLIMSEKDDGQHTGFRTTNTMKTQAVETVRAKITEEALLFSDDHTLVTVSKNHKPQVIKDILINQMSEFAEVLRESEVDKPKKFYSGKAGSGKDDLIITLLLACHWSEFFYKAPKYLTYT